MAVVKWSVVENHEDEFVVFKEDLRLYRYESKSSAVKLSIDDLSLSDTAYGTLIGLAKGYSFKNTCLSWQKSSANPYTFAVSTANGRVQVLGLDVEKPEDNVYRNVLNPRVVRTCSSLEWNPIQYNLLAVGYKGDKSVRSESSLFVLNVSDTVNQPSLPSTEHQTLALQKSGDVGGTANVVLEAGLHGVGDSVSSLCWLPWDANLLAAGMGKVIRIYDIRDEHKTHRPNIVTAAQKFGNFHIAADPLFEHRLATFSDTDHAYVVSMWDDRQFARPVFSIHRQLGIVLQLSWSPVKSGCLALLSQEAPYLRLIDLPCGTEDFHSELYSDDSFVNTLGFRHCYSGQPGTKPLAIQSMNWHPQWDNLMLIAQSSGAVKELEVSDPVSLVWSPSNTLLCGISGDLVNTVPELDKDISMIMKDRAMRGYGLDIGKNISLVSDTDSHLQRAWNWLQEQQNFIDKKMIPTEPYQSTGGVRKRMIPGVWSVLHGDFSQRGTCSQVTPTNVWDYVGTTKSDLPDLKVFVNKERELALLMCGWVRISDESSLEAFCKREEMHDRYERVAALSMFYGNYDRSIESLKLGAINTASDVKRSTCLNMAALALTGLSARPDALWFTICNEMKDSLKEPYLRALFSFLSAQKHDGYDRILESNDLPFQDRVAFACLYLNQKSLMTYLEKTLIKLIDDGCIDGIFLTGITAVGLKLLLGYVDQTGDVQTAYLMAGQALTFTAKVDIVKEWLSCYEELLDKWRLWHIRANLDIERHARESYNVQKQIFLNCNYCGKSVNSSAGRNVRPTKVTCCPNCHKPLPRCAICLNYMGSGSFDVYHYHRSTGEKPSSPFDHWFTWCQTCRHGGHTSHILQWFQNHQECPTVGCSCHCQGLDNSEQGNSSTTRPVTKS